MWCQWGAQPDFCSQSSGCYVSRQKVHIEVGHACMDRGICLHYLAADELAAEDNDVDNTLRGKQDRWWAYRTLLVPVLGVGFWQQVSTWTSGKYHCQSSSRGRFGCLHKSRY